MDPQRARSGAADEAALDLLRAAAAPAELERLRRRVRALEGGLPGTRPARGRPGEPGAEAAACVPTGWEPLDRALVSDGLGGGLVRGALHEWLGLESDAARDWVPPLFVLAHLARRALDERARTPGAGPGPVLWIGRRVWPYPRTLVGDLGVRAASGTRTGARCSLRQGVPLALELERVTVGRSEGRALLEHSIFVDPPDEAGRLWAIDAALRCPSVVAVVADGSRLDLTATRRLQLAARAGATLGLVARPPREASELSAATTRWRVRAAAPDDAAADATDAATDDDALARWSVELLRCKGLQRLRPSDAPAIRGA